MEMEYGKAFTYPQQDPNWLKKWGLAGAISLIPLLGQIVMAGYGVEITRRVIQEEAQPLPEWRDFGGFALKGLLATLINAAYVLPLAVLIGCSYSVQFGLLLGGAQLQSNVAQALETASSAVAICCGCAAALYALAMALMLPAAHGRFAASGQIGSAFQLKAILEMVRAKPGMYFFVVVVGLVGGLAAALGVIACLIGVLWSGAYLTLVNAHLYGQAYRYVTAPDGQ
jgi:hypothetical protein